MLPAALGGVGQEQLNNNFPPQKIWAKPPPLLKLWRAVGCGGNESVCPPAPPCRRRAGSGKAFPQFLRQQEGKTEKFSFP